MKTIASLALFALLAGCSGGGATSVVSKVPAPAGVARLPQTQGGPGTTTLTYYDTYAPTGQCHPGVLTLNVSYYPATHLHFAAGDGPPIVVSNCNFQTNQYVKVTLGTPAYGSPFVRQTDYTVTVDSAAAASVTATWQALGPTLPGSPGLTGTVSYTIDDPCVGCGGL